MREHGLQQEVFSGLLLVVEEIAFELPYLQDMGLDKSVVLVEEIFLGLLRLVGLIEFVDFLIEAGLRIELFHILEDFLFGLREPFVHLLQGIEVSKIFVAVVDEYFYVHEFIFLREEEVDFLADFLIQVPLHEGALLEANHLFLSPELLPQLSDPILFGLHFPQRLLRVLRVLLNGFEDFVLAVVQFNPVLPVVVSEHVAKVDDLVDINDESAGELHVGVIGDGDGLQILFVAAGHMADQPIE